MITRREFAMPATGAVAGIAFTGCGMLDAAHAAQPAAKRRHVAVKGHRVKTVDVLRIA